MSERGMGSAVGQVPEYIEMVTKWCKESTDLPVIVKLTPNITNIIYRPLVRLIGSLCIYIVVALAGSESSARTWPRAVDPALKTSIFLVFS